MANAELASANKNWEEVLRGKVHVSSSSQTKRPTDGSVHTGPEIDALFELALQNVPEYSSFRKFVESVHSWWETNGYLSQAQYDAIRKAARK
jgi:hypothetical protein